MNNSILIFRAFPVLLLMGLTACSGVTVEEPEPYITTQDDRIREQNGTVHGNPKGFVLFSDREQEGEVGPAAANGSATNGLRNPSITASPRVNSYLWQASLESLDFMPLNQADSSGGVIITDWFAPPETPDERFKVTVYVLDQNLRADALKVKVFRQVKESDDWANAAVDKTTAVGLEDNILRRARELRLTSTGEISDS
ncbi:MAG: DUF3576 domain-containing protein [Geminicoccaceae bacterium]